MTDEMALLRAADPARGHVLRDPAHALAVRGAALGRAGHDDHETPGRHRVRRRLVIVPLTVVALAALGAGGYAAISGDRLGVLAQPATPTTTVPARLQSEINQVSQSGETPSDGREAAKYFGYTFYVVPGSHGKVCIEIDPGAAGCSPQSQVETGTFTGMFPFGGIGVPAGDYMFYGLLPDGVSNVQMHFSDDTELDVTVTNDVYAFARSPDSIPTRIVWTDSEGQPHSAALDATIPALPGGRPTETGTTTTSSSSASGSSRSRP